MKASAAVRRVLRSAAFRMGLLLFVLPAGSYFLYLNGELVFLVPLIVLPLFILARFSKSYRISHYREAIPTFVFAALLVWLILAFDVQDIMANSPLGTLLADLTARFSAAFLNVIGIGTLNVNNTLVFPPGSKVGSIEVGPLCTSSYSSIAFMAVFTVMLVDLRLRIPKSKMVELLAAGIGGLILLDVLRIGVLVWVGYLYGMDFMEAVHLYLGLALFVLFSGAFWGLALRKLPKSRT